VVDGGRDAKLKNKHNQAGERKNQSRSLSPSISPAIFKGGAKMKVARYNAKRKELIFWKDNTEHFIYCASWKIAKEIAKEYNNDIVKAVS